MTKKIKDLLNYDILETFLNAPLEFFHQFGTVYTAPDNMIYIHRDIGASILGVAHLDSVNPHNHFYVNRFAGDDVIFNTRLDDRLGAYIILDLLPKAGIHVDWLLTEGEEVGKSTAKHFKTDKQYRWMFSFDRNGTDAVHYRYSQSNWLGAIRKIFGHPAHGSMSDIDYLSHLKCCGVNVGTGYHDEHRIMAYANMSETLRQVGKFIQFYQNNKRTWYEHKEYTYTPPKPFTATPPPAQLPTTKEVAVAEPIDEELEVEPINPYDEMVVQYPLDIDEYLTADRHVIMPTKCAFCLEPISIDNRHAFLGICDICEMWAIQCYVCHEFFQRKDTPTEDMEMDMLYFGICCVCERRLDEDPKFQTDSTTPGCEPNNPDPGAESPFG